jgi:peptidoglycan/xylan/chitin deacetylase (PgdA/CDA1 family)
VAEALSRHAQTVATIVTYHFVQPALAGPLAGLKRLDLAAFREQVTYIRRHYTPVSVFDLVRAAGDASALPPRPIVLSFDDGYRGHFHHVLPLLDSLSIPAVFFPVASPLLDRRVLDVNKIQCVLAAADDVGRLVAAIETAIERHRHEAGLPAPAEYREKWWKPSRWDPPAVVYVKRLLQHALPEPIRRPLLDGLFRELVSDDEAAFADEFYMSVGEARGLRAAGMTVGAHGDRHLRLPTLSREDQASEIDGALRVLDAVGVPRQRFVYCYANGEYDNDSLDLLRARGCSVAFTTRPDLARIAADDMLTLPRIDANDLPVRSDAEPNEWTRRAAALSDAGAGSTSDP